MADSLTCADLKAVEPGLACCGMCHDAWAEGYDEPSEVQVGAVQLRVCCMMQTDVEALSDAGQAQVVAAALAGPPGA